MNTVACVEGFNNACIVYLLQVHMRNAMALDYYCAVIIIMEKHDLCHDCKD